MTEIDLGDRSNQSRGWMAIHFFVGGFERFGRPSIK